jgi:hypothetical protein
LQSASACAWSAQQEFETMKSLSDGITQFRLETDFQRGLAFTLVSSVILCALLIAELPHWAGPWLIASLFTFAVWRLNRQQSS